MPLRLKTVVSALLVLAVLAGAGCSFKDQPDGYVARTDEWDQRASRKFSRGMTNILLSPLEVPNQMANMAMEGDTVMEASGGYVGGLFIAPFYMLGRIVSGVGDVISAPLGWPATNGMEHEYAYSELIAVDEEIRAKEQEFEYKLFTQ